MAENNADLLEVRFGKIGKRRQIDAVLDETLGVFAKAEALKPVFDPLALPSPLRATSALHTRI
jgi:hypothetical protein